MYIKYDTPIIPKIKHTVYRYRWYKISWIFKLNVEKKRERRIYGYCSVYVTPFVSVTHVQNILCSVACLIFNFFFYFSLWKYLKFWFVLHHLDDSMKLKCSWFVYICFIIRDYDDAYLLYSINMSGLYSDLESYLFYVSFRWMRTLLLGRVE